MLQDLHAEVASLREISPRFARYLSSLCI